MSTLLNSMKVGNEQFGAGAITIPPGPVRLGCAVCEVDARDGYGFLNRLAALILLVLLSPVIVATFVLLWLVEGGHVLYAGERVGLGGRVFRMYKFRTMKIGAEQHIGRRLMRSTDRITTPVGRVLRYLKIDELPQLWNVLRGDMNLVGPRPVRPCLAVDYSAKVNRYAERFAVKPGMTGLAQIRGGYYCKPARKTRYDRFYVAHRSLGYDISLLLGTVWYMAGSITRLKIRTRS